jgi:nicotinate-nucleotide adenylyltransferase
MRRCALDEVLFVPAATPPHKSASTPFEDRYRMVELACDGQPGFTPCPIEAHREQSYSIITIQELRAANPDDEFLFLIGADAFAEIRTWHRWAEVAGLIEFIVVSRPGHTYQVPEGARVVPLEGLDIDTSSTELRGLLASGHVCDLPAQVAMHILERELYGTAAAAVPRLETQRLRLRALSPRDHGFVAALYADPEVMRHDFGGVRAPADADECATSDILHAREGSDFGTWIVERREGCVRVGWVVLRRYSGRLSVETEIGYEFAPEHWGRGYALEAVRRVVRFAFQRQRLRRVVAIVRPSNRRSVRLLKKLGFRKRMRHPKDTDGHDFYVVGRRRFFLAP